MHIRRGDVPLFVCDNEPLFSLYAGRLQHLDSGRQRRLQMCPQSQRLVLAAAKTRAVNLDGKLGGALGRVRTLIYYI